MDIVNGSIVVEADGVRHTVADFSFGSFESAIGFVGFAVQFLNETLSDLFGHEVPVHCEIDPIPESDEYNAMVVVSVPDSEVVTLLWAVMVFICEGISNVAVSEDLDLVAWATYEEMGGQA